MSWLGGRDAGKAGPLCSAGETDGTANDPTRMIRATGQRVITFLNLMRSGQQFRALTLEMQSGSTLVPRGNRNVPGGRSIEVSSCFSCSSRENRHRRGCGNVGIAGAISKGGGKRGKPMRGPSPLRGFGGRVFHTFHPAVISTARPASAPSFSPPVFPQPDSAAKGGPLPLCALR